MKKLILASTSPRRAALLKQIGLNFLVKVSAVDETPLPGLTPPELVGLLAERKAAAVARKLHDGIVIGADTVVVWQGQVLGKPKNGDEAFEMLFKVQGSCHEVYTGIALVDVSSGEVLVQHEKTRVCFRSLNEREIRLYVASGEPLDKAGAYAIQHPEFRPVIKFAGCYASVMGLPLCHVERTFRKMGFGEHREIPFQCQNNLSYACPIYKLVLAGEEVG